jgi:acyl-CoA thioesterase
MKVEEIIRDRMYQNDTFSQWLGIEIIECGLGECKLKMQITKDMLNGFGIAHGGISYSFADSAFAFSCNSRGEHAVSIETSISHLQPLYLGDIIFAHAKEKSRSRKIGLYEIEVKSDKGDLVAAFKGTCYIKDKKWE